MHSPFSPRVVLKTVIETFLNIDTKGEEGKKIEF